MRATRTIHRRESLVIFSWDFFIDLGILGVALMVATWLRSKLKFLQTFLIPNSLTAGFLLFPFYNWVFPHWGMGRDHLEIIVYHFLSLSFIANTLRTKTQKSPFNKDVFATSVMVITQYALQSFLGTLIVLILIHTFLPNLFPGFGLFSTLGYALGPGQAFAIGSGWEEFGFPGLGSVGLTFGALGFIWASIGGIFLINRGLKKGWISHPKKTLESKTTSDTINSDAIDPLSFSSALIFATYLLSYLGLTGITKLLSLLGEKGLNLSVNLWGILFIFSALTALVMRKLIFKLKAGHLIDIPQTTRIMGFSVDYMVTAAIAAISVSVVTDYWIPITIVAIFVGAATFFTHVWLSSRIFQTHVFHRTIMIYGIVTGTLPTGLALLRVIDPHFESPASREYTLAASIVFVFIIPILLTANMPALGALKGDLKQTWIVLCLYALYLLLCFVAYLILSKKNSFRNSSKLWLER